MDNLIRSQTVVVVPCFNEERRLRLSAFGSYLSSSNSAHIFFVDDGSSDDTLPLLLRFHRRHPLTCTVAKLPQNRGKAEAVRQGMLSAIDGGAQLVGYWDADLATPLREISHMRAVLSRDPETMLVIGIRERLLGRRIHRSIARRSLGYLSALLTRSLTRLGTRDTQCGAKLFRATETLEQSLKYKFQSRWLFDVELMMRMQTALGPLRDFAYEMPLDCWAEQGGSKVNGVAYLRSLRDLLRLTWAFSRRVPRTNESTHSDISVVASAARWERQMRAAG